MNSRTARGRALLFAVCSLFCFAAQAGRPCLHQPATPHVLRDAAEASTKVSALLSASHEQIALLARIGQDLSKQSLLYSHAGFAVRDADGHWQVIHLLNSCGTDRGKLVSEGLLQFYLDDLLSYQTKIVFFPPKLADALRTALLTHQGKAVFQAHYSVIARAYSHEWQNSTAWVLELIAAASVPGPDSRAEAFEELRRRGYEAQVVRIAYTQRLGAALFRSNIQFLEHPVRSRIGGRYQTTSVRSILQFLRRQDLLASEGIWVPPGKAALPGD